jgi:hypothetical protein
MDSSDGQGKKLQAKRAKQVVQATRSATASIAMKELYVSFT